MYIYDALLAGRRLIVAPRRVAGRLSERRELVKSMNRIASAAGAYL